MPSNPLSFRVLSAIVSRSLVAEGRMLSNFTSCISDPKTTRWRVECFLLCQNSGSLSTRITERRYPITARLLLLCLTAHSTSRQMAFAMECTTIRSIVCGCVSLDGTFLRWWNNWCWTKERTKRPTKQKMFRDNLKHIRPFFVSLRLNSVWQTLLHHASYMFCAYPSSSFLSPPNRLMVFYRSVAVVSCTRLETNGDSFCVYL